MFGAEWFGRIAAPDATAWGAVLAAPFVGSFLGVLVRRLPESRPIIWARSQCEGCGAALRPRDLVPLVSWLATRGRCRFCRIPLGHFYPAIELAAVAVALVAATVDGGAAAWLDCLLGWWLLTLAWIDARHWLLPDALTLPLVLAGLIAALAFDSEGLLDRALGAAAGYLALRAIALLYRALRGREGLGEGDAKLLAASGAWVGASGLPQVVLIAALAGLIVAAGLRLAGFRLGPRSALPFGPFLALATWLVWLLPMLPPI
ncbi:MAG TPA: A24 family peptidase [Stellaceae bacterium]|jgi:leader peptidase (prepilin peptidase)/N-methyltransferase